MDMQDPYRAPATVTPPPLAAALPRPRAVAQDWATDKAVFFSPGTFKLAAMSLSTFGLYPVYWFWRNWQAIHRETGDSLWPWARAIFAPLWSFSCFARLNEMTSSRRRALAFPAVLLGIVFFGLNLLGALANGGALLSLFTFVPLLPVNTLLRQYHRDERIDLRRMDRLSIWHVLIMVLGGLFLLLALVGLGMREARSL